MARLYDKSVVPNLLSFDIEGLAESSLDIMELPQEYLSPARENREIEANTLDILDLLAKGGQKATFFVLGRIARDMPRLVRSIAEAGHEVACHGLHHRRLYHFARPEVTDLLRCAKHYLEDLLGEPVYGFRAPDFSITAKNIWAFDVLRELGFLYDSSVYPTNLHDVYGIAAFPRVPCRLPNGLIEFPMSVVTLPGMSLPFGGGGYLRLYPLALTRLFFRRLNRKAIPGMVYFHPFETGNTVLHIKEMSRFRKFRTYVGVRTAKKKLERLIRGFEFVRIKDYVDQYPIGEA